MASATVESQKSSFFRKQEDNIRQARVDAEEHAKRVEGFDNYCLATIPWLRTTNIVDYIKGLNKQKLLAAIALPQDSEAVLRIVLIVMNEIL